MKIYLPLSLILIVAVLKQADCWKPISHPAAFTVEQTFLDVGPKSISRSSSNSIIHGSSSSNSIIHGSNSVDSFINPFSKHSLSDASCAAEKFALDHEATIKYGTKFAKLDQFTLCMWVRFTKHDGDHTLFTYSVHDEPREIQFWVANSNSSSFISMAVRGHSLYRLGYPLALKKWHHTCTSWNGKTGEWQLWIKSERVGRGFYNRLVSHEIEAGGNAFSGGKSPNGPVADGLHFEITLLQMYSVALSAGKAHRSHKHHHVHKFDHNGEIETTTTPAPPPPVNQPVNPLLANGQFPTRVKINLAGAQQSEVAQQLPTINTNFVRGQFHTGTRNLQQQLLNGNIEQLRQSQLISSQTLPPPSNPVFRDSKLRTFSTSTYHGFGSNPANIEVIDGASLPTFRFKREQAKSSKNVQKRDLVTLTDGSIVDDKFFDSDWFDGLAQFGDNKLKQSLTQRTNLEDEVKEHDKEPADGEVEAVRAYCSYCLIEPFEGALVLSWRDASPGSQVLKAKASTVCGDF